MYDINNCIYNYYCSLLVVCGSIFGNRIIGEDDIAVPDYCWKIVFSLTTNEILSCMIFPNDESDTYNNIGIEDLKQRLSYNLIY
jgi:hypothetical protein